MNTYLEIVNDDTNEVVKRLDVTNQSKRQRELIENGMNRNLNHNDYHVNEKETKLTLELI